MDTPFKPLQPGASREEVLAAVEHSDRIVREILAEQDQADDAFSQLVTRTHCHFGDPRDEDPSLARQRVAGEEDQSVPGWDFRP